MEEIEALKNEDRDLRSHIDTCNSTLQERIEKNEQIHQKFAKDYKSGFDYTQDRIQKVEDVLSQAQKVIRGHSYDLKNQADELEQIGMRLASFIEETGKNFIKYKEDFKERLMEIDTITKESLEDLNHQLDRVHNLARD